MNKSSSLRKVVLLTKLILLCGCLMAQKIHPDILSKKWKASWIEVPGESKDDYGVYKFRTTIELKERPATFIVHVSADNRYKLYVNEKEVSHGPARGDLTHYNFETVDIASYLRPGKNILGALVWNFGEHRPEAQISYRTAFILQGDTQNEEIVNTGKNWKCIRDESFEPLNPVLNYTFYVAGPGEKIDFNKYIDDWKSESFDDGAWKNAKELFAGLPKGVFEWTNGWMLVPRPIPQMELVRQRFASVRMTDGVSLPKTFPAAASPITISQNKKIKILLDQGTLTNAYPELRFSKGKGAIITISYAEALYKIENSADWRTEAQKGNRNEIENKRFVGVKDQLISAGDDNQSFTSLAFRTFRYVELEIQTSDEALVINDFYSWFTGYPFKFNAQFDAKNTELNKMLEVGWRTARLCAIETYTDCPYYEQLQYIGDTRIQALVSLFNSGDETLVQNAINQLDNSRLAEGITLSRYPSANPQQIPTFSLYWIGMVHDYWRYRPNENFVKGKLPGVRQVLHFFQQYQQPDGSLKDAPYWEFTDWAVGEGWNRGMAPIGKNGNSAALDLQLCIAYQLAAELEEATGMKAFSQQYRAAADQLKQTIKTKYWSSIKQLYADTPEQDMYSQHTNTLAVLAGLAEGNDARLLMEKVLSDDSITKATIYFKYYVHLAAAKVGLGDRYIDMLGDWREQLANGLTTWAEISDHNRSRSDCHAWGASPNIELFRIVLGIDSDGPGFQKVKIEPHLGKLTQAHGKIPHPNGEISVSYAQIRGKWRAEITLPKGTPGTFIWKGKIHALKPGEKNLLAL